MGKEANNFKAQYLDGNRDGICGGHTCEGGCALPGEICRIGHFRIGRQTASRGAAESGRSQQMT